jgi:superfamily II DNA or RNA helicase
MKIIIPKNRYENIQIKKDQYDWHPEKFNPDIYTVTTTKDKVLIQFSAEKSFRAKYLDKEKLSSRAQITIAQLVQQGVDEIVYNIKDVDELFSLVSEIDKKSREITLNEDLSFKNDHPIINEIHLKGWENTHNRDVSSPNVSEYQLQHPFYYEEDIKTLEFQNFVVKVTPKQREKLTFLHNKEALLLGQVYVYPSQKGYIIFAHTLNADLIKQISEKGKVQYFERDDEGVLQPKTLEFIQNIYITKGGNIAYPDNYHDLQNNGYKAYECQMFTLPSIGQLFTKMKVKVEGIENVYPPFPALTFPIKPIEENKTFKKLPFQDKAIENWVQAGKLGTIALPTGSGKTIIALQAIEKLRLKTLIVTPTIEMLNQWKQMLVHWLCIPEDKIGLYYGSEKQIRDITIITFQSGHRKINSEVEADDEIKVDETLIDEIGKLSESVGFLIMDEGHHSAAPVFMRIMTKIKSRYRMSLTATPYREDKNETLAFLAMGDVVLQEDYYTLAVQKVVSPIDYKRIKVAPTTTEESIILLKASFIRGDRWMRGYYNSCDKDGLAKDQKKMVELWKKGTYFTLHQEMDKDYDIESTRQIQIRNLFGFSDGKWLKLQEIMKENENKKILIFNEFVEGAALIGYYLKKLGYNSKVLTGSTKPAERKAIFDKFKSSKQFILTTTTVLDEGINVPDCDVVIIFNGSRSKRQMIQRVGRGCRYRPGKVEKVYELVCAPEDAGREGKHYGQKGDDFIMQRMNAKKQEGGRVPYGSQLDKGSYGGGLKEVSDREQILYEWEKAMYRDITPIINIEKQAELIKQTITTEAEKTLEAPKKPKVSEPKPQKIRISIKKDKVHCGLCQIEVDDWKIHCETEQHKKGLANTDMLDNLKLANQTALIAKSLSLHETEK